MRLETPKWHDIPKHWPAIEQWVGSALEHGGVTLYPNDIYQGLVTRNMKLWLAFEKDQLMACCVTQIVNYQRMRCLNILVVGGHDLENWMHFYHRIEEYARTLDCDAVEFGGRGGWSRKMTVYGFKPVYLIHRKML